MNNYEQVLLRELKNTKEAKDVAYSERNELVAFLSRLYPSHLCRHPEGDVEWEDDWRWIVCIHSPAGQLTWHIHDSELRKFASLGEKSLEVGNLNHWDGHTTEEKYERLR